MTEPETGTDKRRDELEAGLSATRERIASACAAAGRDSSEVTLVVVTKYFPASDLRLLRGLGVRDVGESRHQEAARKADELEGLGLVWHFIGNLQSNKAALLAAYADVVHSVDRAKLLPGLGTGARRYGRVLDVLVQVDLGEVPRPGRGGVRPDRVRALAEQTVGTDGLRLRGVMGVAPLGADPADGFARLAGAAAAVRRVEPSATWVSAGMSGDLEEAVRAGATHVRVGGAILGSRVPGR